MKFGFALIVIKAALLVGCSTAELQQIASIADTATRGTSMNPMVGIGAAAIPPNEQLLEA